MSSVVGDIWTNCLLFLLKQPTLPKHLSSTPFCLLVLVGFVLFNVVKLQVFAFSVPCCDLSTPCSYGQNWTRCRIGHGRITHSYLLNNEERPKCIPCDSNYSLKHVLIDRVDVADIRHTFYNVNNFIWFIYKCRSILKF